MITCFQIIFQPVTKVPLPLEPIKSNQVEDRRLWVGNLDLRINE